MRQAHADGETGAQGIADECGLLNVKGVHEGAEGVEEKGRRILQSGFVGQSRARHVKRQHTMRAGQCVLLMFPVPHGASQAVEQNHGRAFSVVQPGEAVSIHRARADPVPLKQGDACGNRRRRRRG